MEAPEKIYLFENPITEEADERWLTKRSDKKDIEYVNAKQLINKVCDFIKVNSYKYGKIKFVDDKATFDFRTDSLIEDLKENILY